VSKANQTQAITQTKAPIVTHISRPQGTLKKRILPRNFQKLGLAFFCHSSRYDGAGGEVLNNGPAPLISAMCRALGITQAIDRLTEWDDR
jgi:hypothetical protein